MIGRLVGAFMEVAAMLLFEVSPLFSCLDDEEADDVERCERALSRGKG